jgi:hypothetical protein
MDTIEKYRDIIIHLLEEHANVKFSYANVESIVLIDKKNDHYQLCRVGWTYKESRIYGPVFHFSIKNQKIYIEHNGSDLLLSEILVSKGVPKTDIVIANQPPSYRKYTEYAIA